MKQLIIAYLLIASFVFITHKDSSAKQDDDPGLTYTEPCYGDYPKEPPFLSQSAKSSTTLLVDFSGSLNEHAYQEREVNWDTNSTNATAYSGYDSNSTYYGYFDSNYFYTYDMSLNLFKNSTISHDDTWSGNFLNWVSMHRIDIMKKALTGGNAILLDSTSGTYKYTVSSTEEGFDRGKYHIVDPNTFNSTGEIPTAFQNTVLGFEQKAGTAMLSVYSMNKTSSNPETYKPLNELNSYSLTVIGNKPLGTLHKIGPSTRLALFTFDDEDPAQGGKALVYMTDNSTEVINTINNYDVSNASSWSNISESLHTVIGYIQNATDVNVNDGPRYNKSSYETSATRDPYYFPEKQVNVPCTQQNIIIISDGIPNQDTNIPNWLNSTTYDQSNNDYLDTNGVYIDNISYWAHTTDLRTDLDGFQNVNIYAIALYSSNSTYLKDAAKWGGFTDFNADGDIADNELTDKFGKPYTFFDILSSSDTGRKLEKALTISAGSTISKASSGGSASIVTTSSDGEGLLYHPIFWPQLKDSKDNSISWAGDVKTFWLDNSGILYADDGKNSTHQLDGDDTPITIWYDESDLDNKRTRVCPSANFTNGQCSGGDIELNEVKPVWSAAKQLYDLSNDTIDVQGSYGEPGKRYIFTWIDNNVGVVDSITPFDDRKDSELLKFLNAETINWIRGKDQDELGLRSRATYVDTEKEIKTWRLGDIINSSPTIVGAPSENYDIYWKDDSYSKFREQYKNRRIMAYFGANDGMLHAVNSGFYNKSDKKYYLTEDFAPDPDSGVMKLGDEMWAYVPYNLLPHLECLTKPGYQHQYYVDLKPRVFDVKAFGDKDNDKYPNGWGTILVGGFGFGGDGLQDLGMVREEHKEYFADRYFGSSYFIFDITNPDEPPILLGEMTFDGSVTLGFSISPPTVVATTDGTSDTNAPNTTWYLLFGNGPEDLSGTSSQPPYGLVIPLKGLINQDFGLRLSKSKNNLPGPTETSLGFIDFGQNLGGGSNFRACISTGFVSIDYDNNNFVDMMYYGLITTPDAVNRGGGMHRLRVEDRDPSKWSVKEMTTTDQPVTGAPNAAAKDIEGKTGSIWVTFGTGIFWENADKENTTTNWIYGIEEPKKAGSYNFSPIDTKSLYDVTGIGVNGTEGLGTLVCEPEQNCNIPDGINTVEQLGDYIETTANIDGWKRQLLTSGERVLGQPTVFGGLTNFTTYTPANDLCSSDGNSKLYALYYRTGTPWKVNVFGDTTEDYVPYVVNLGRGVSITPSLHLGSEEGVKAYVQTSTGSIVEIHQPNLPVTGVKSGMGGWHTLGIE